MLINQTKELLKEMEFILVGFAKFNKERYNLLVEIINQIEQVELEKLYQFLFAFRTNEYHELYKIFRLPLDNSNNGPELWERYFKNRRFGLIEMQMFRKQTKICKETWINRPRSKIERKLLKEIINQNGHSNLLTNSQGKEVNNVKEESNQTN